MQPRYKPEFAGVEGKDSMLCGTLWRIYCSTGGLNILLVGVLYDNGITAWVRHWQIELDINLEDRP